MIKKKVHLGFQRDQVLLVRPKEMKFQKILKAAKGENVFAYYVFNSSEIYIYIYLYEIKILDLLHIFI